jgi:hypothetical protein
MEHWTAEILCTEALQPFCRFVYAQPPRWKAIELLPIGQRELRMGGVALRAATAVGDRDALVASAKAYLAALNKLMARQLRGQSDERRLHSTDVG